MTYFHRTGSTFRATAEANIDIKKALPLGTYSVKVDMAGFFLEQVEDLELSDKIYGDTNKNVDRVMRTFNDRPASTGVLLQGEKGSGKTLFARLISKRLREEEGVITLLVNSSLRGEGFNTFIASITQPTLIIFDEFEKVYQKEEQSALLTLFDGIYSTKKLFIVTVNDIYRVSDFFINRPGRFFYSFKYDGLNEAFIREYCQDKLKDKTQIDSVCNYSRCFAKFNFDILKAIVEEMNRYGETVAEAARHINATPAEQRVILEVESIKGVGEEKVEEKYFIGQKFNGGAEINPFKGNIYFYSESIPRTDVILKKGDDPEDAVEYKEYYFDSKDLKKMVDGKYLFNNGKVEVLAKHVVKEAPEARVWAYL